MVQAWEWSEKDAILHMLPMHHIHGIVNAWLCAHNAGATVEFMDKFVPSDVWGEAPHCEHVVSRARVSALPGCLLN